MVMVEEAQASLERMQKFDVDSLAREADLGARLNFSAAVAPAQRLVRLYRQLGQGTLVDFPPDILDQIKRQADADFNRFQSLLDFSPDQSNPGHARDQLVLQIEHSYQQTFQALYMPIAYGVSKSTDFQRMETDARAAIQAISDQAKGITEDLAEKQRQANVVLDDVRRLAAEQGVSQQSIYFKHEAKEHRFLADKWKLTTIWLSVGVGAYAFFSIFLHKIPYLSPGSPFESAQLIASKILIFGVLSYMLILSAKNFLNHKHNEIVNKHRQNALMTFNALVDAAKDDASRDVVLTHASSCIFTPQETGYTKQQNSQSPSIGELIPKTVIRLDKGS